MGYLLHCDGGLKIYNAAAQFKLMYVDSIQLTAQ